MKKIIVYPDKNLRNETPELFEVDKKILSEIKSLSQILEKGENAAGLAAPQIGLNRRFFGIKDNELDKVSIFINPKIVKKFGEKIFPKIIDKDDRDQDFFEGCMSFPNYFGTVKRYLKLRVSWQEIENNKLVTKNKDIVGFEAIVFQHEFDHLNGVLFVDRVKEDGGKFFKSVNEKMIVWSLDKVIDGQL